MKILITHVSNTFNYGTAMMAINLIYYLNQNYDEKLEFYTDIIKDNDLDRIKRSTGIENIQKTNLEVELHNLPIKKGIDKILYMPVKLTKLFSIFNNFSINVIKNFDVLIVLGGDDLSEYYSKIILLGEFYKISKISKMRKVILVGQTIGPFYAWRKKLASTVLKDIDIYTRDTWTYRYLKQDLKVDNLFDSRDLAFMKLPRQDDENIKKTISKYNLKQNEYITLVPSGLYKSYTESYEDYIEGWKKIIIKILSNKKFSNKKIVLLSHVLKPKDVDDGKVINSLKLTFKDKDNIVFVTEELLPDEARNILGNGILTITGRMHAAISTFQMNKPAISLSYSVKYKGVIGEGLNMNSLVIESANSDKWKSGSIVNEVINKIDYVMNNYDELNNKIRLNVKECEEKSMQQIIDICHKLKKLT